MSDDAHFRLRIPRHLKEWVEKSAQENNRSINAEILSCIEIAMAGMTVGSEQFNEVIESLKKEVYSQTYSIFKAELDKIRTEFEKLLTSRP